MKSNMLVMDGGAGAVASEQSKTATNAKQSIAERDRNAQFSKDVLALTTAEQTAAAKLNNLNSTIAQGKIVDAVLETAINTDLPGTLRAIVSRDVYAESGRNIMIHRGSRLIGTYNTEILRGQSRVFIIWTRLIRPDGVDIAIGSAGIDTLGRAGMSGHVDNKYFETFSAALLTSMISIGAAVTTDSLIGGSGTSTQNTDGSVSSTGSPGSAAASSAVTTIGTISRDIINNTLDLRPTITVDQGARVNVFVNKDLIFPTSGDGLGLRFIQ